MRVLAKFSIITYLVLPSMKYDSRHICAEVVCTYFYSNISIWIDECKEPPQPRRMIISPNKVTKEKKLCEI